MDISLAILGTGILILIALGSVFVGGLIFFSALFNKRLEEVKANQARLETKLDQLLARKP